MRPWTWWRFYFRGKKCPEMCLKINRSVKTPWHRPSMGVARSWLWAPGTVIYLYLLFPLECYTIFDFEDHNLSQWTLTGTAFNNQPTYGDIPSARRGGHFSNHKGDWWIGTFENRPSPSYPVGRYQYDSPQGSMTSPGFSITGKSLRFLIGGGCDPSFQDLRAELIIEGQVVLVQTAKRCAEAMTEKSWDVTSYVGKHAQLRLIDHSSGVWGHLNFDHFQACHKLI